jgi:hypothetical protein
MSLSVSPSIGYLILTERLPLATTQRSGNIQISIYPEWYKQVSVEWSVPASWGPCLFNVYFSQVEDGEFVKLNSTPINGTYLIDITTREYSKTRRGFYVVEALLQNSGNTAIRSNPESWFDTQRRWVELRSIEIQRREYWLLSRFAGIKSYLFRRRNYGQRCRTCWNPIYEKVMIDHCPDCLGSSFEGGYFNPAPLYVQYDANPDEKLKTYIGDYEPNQIGAWTISIPVIRPDDIIIRTGSWGIYKVTKLTPTELQGNVVRQIMVLTELSKSDVEYQLVKRGLPEFPTEFAT